MTHVYIIARRIFEYLKNNVYIIIKNVWPVFDLKRKTKM